MVNANLPVHENEDQKLFPAILEKADVQIESDAIAGRVFGALFLCARKIRHLVGDGSTVDDALDSEEVQDALDAVRAAVQNGDSESSDNFAHSIETHISGWENNIPQPHELYAQGGDRERSTKNTRKGGYYEY